MKNEPDAEPLLWFDWSDDDSASAAVIEAVGSVSGDDVTEMAPLFDAVDPDALDTILSRPAGDTTSLSVEFPYNGYSVAVEASGDGWVRA